MKTIKLSRFYSACAIFFAGLGVMVSCQAQSVPMLPKEWKGEISGTSIGSNHKKANPNQFARGWNTYDEVRTLIVLRQEG